MSFEQEENYGRRSTEGQAVKNQALNSAFKPQRYQGLNEFSILFRNYVIL